MTAPDRIESAVERWLHALHALGEPLFVEAAFADDAVLERYGWDEDPRPKEVFEGHAAIAGWLGRSPVGTRFTAGTPEQANEGHHLTYTVTLKDFRNHGRWRVILAPDGRIHTLEHRPTPLPEPEIT